MGYDQDTQQLDGLDGHWAIKWEHGLGARFTVHHGRFTLHGRPYQLDPGCRSFTWHYKAEQDISETRQLLQRKDPDGTCHWTTNHPDYPTITWIPVTDHGSIVVKKKTELSSQGDDDPYLPVFESLDSDKSGTIT